MQFRLLNMIGIEMCIAKSREMEELFDGMENLGFVIVNTTLPTRLRGYDNLTKLLRAGQSGVALGNPGEQQIMVIQTPRHFKVTPEIGFWYKRGDVKQVKIPLV